MTQADQIPAAVRERDTILNGLQIQFSAAEVADSAKGMALRLVMSNSAFMNAGVLQMINIATEHASKAMTTNGATDSAIKQIPEHIYFSYVMNKLCSYFGQDRLLFPTTEILRVSAKAFIASSHHIMTMDRVIKVLDDVVYSAKLMFEHYFITGDSIEEFMADEVVNPFIKRIANDPMEAFSWTSLVSVIDIAMEKHNKEPDMLECLRYVGACASAVISDSFPSIPRN